MTATTGTPNRPDPIALPPAGTPLDVDAAKAGAVRAADALRSAATGDDAIAVVLEWNGDTANEQTWMASQGIAFRRDTKDPAAQEGRRVLDASAPGLAEARRTFLDAVADSPHVDAIRARFGDAVVDRWRAEASTFDPSIGELLTREKTLEGDYTSLTGGAQVEVNGETKTLAHTMALLFNGDRDVRRAGARAVTGWYHENGDALDELYGQLVDVRTRIAQGLGHGDFIDTAYRRMRRTDFGPDDVATFRRAIEEHVVPVASELRREQAQALGIPSTTYYDEQVLALGEEPRPGGDAAWMQQRADEMFGDIDATHGTRLRELSVEMQRRGLFDLEARAGKATGGFCSFLATSGLPFVFANFNGTSGDVRVFTHEMGHAYQGWCSARNTDLVDQRRCTSESAEIHSMSLEFLTIPYMDRFFGEGAERFRTSHLARAITFLPYGCLVDHFQHEVYANPSLSAQERRAIWRDLEARYLPTRDWDGLPIGGAGGAWQIQLHLYQYPFYYIDYVIAQLVALQFAELLERDASTAWSHYQTLCDLGGKLPVRELVREVGLSDPFAEETVEAVVRSALAR